MHYVPFVLKRAHHVTLKMLRPIAARYELTPARFDLLSLLLLRAHEVQVFPQQNHIANALGVCRSTVCKMIAALEKAGFVRREVDYFDRRCRRIKLTCYGRRAVLGVLKTIRRGEVDRMLLRPHFGLRDYSRGRRADFLHSLATSVSRFVVGMKDRALRIYRLPAWRDRRQFIAKTTAQWHLQHPASTLRSISS